MNILLFLVYVNMNCWCLQLQSIGLFKRFPDKKNKLYIDLKAYFALFGVENETHT